MSAESLLLGTNPVTGPAYWAYQVKGSVDASAEVRRAQSRLEQQRKKELDDQAAARAAAAAKAATSGQRVGLRSQFVSGVGGAALGFGSGTTSPGLSAGSLFGN
jgi:hypothetical protein